ncbi:MAG TPA: hypothetical protein VGL13_16735 [Polyangiaceae bacterium]|jgi:hypothetical protein
MSDNSTELKAELKKGLGRLQSLRDEVRVKINLASLTLKDQWKKMEPRLEEVERAAQDISETSRTALTDALKRLEQLRDNLRSVNLHGSGGTPGTGNDTGHTE